MIKAEDAYLDSRIKFYEQHKGILIGEICKGLELADKNIKEAINEGKFSVEFYMENPTKSYNYWSLLKEYICEYGYNVYIDTNFNNNRSKILINWMK